MRLLVCSVEDGEGSVEPEKTQRVSGRSDRPWWGQQGPGHQGTKPRGGPTGLGGGSRGLGRRDSEDLERRKGEKKRKKRRRR